MTTFQSFPINHVNVQDKSISIHRGTDTWCSLILSTYKQATEGDPDSKHTLFISLDGTNGADFHTLLHSLHFACEQENIPTTQHFTAEFLKSESELRSEMAHYLTDNRAFGYTATDVQPIQYFQNGAKTVWSQRATELSANGGIVVLYGPGASLISGGESDLNFYADYSRENQQKRHSPQFGNFGFGGSSDRVEIYKNCYFLEWPVWETYRNDWLAFWADQPHQNAYYMDMNRPDEPIWLPVTSLKHVLHKTSHQPFRVKPFFSPGIWGGQYLKELCGLPDEWPNCAWSFEPIAPENTLLLRIDGITLEVPFTLLMEASPNDIMGKRNVELFGSYFPIRFNYLDTMEGGYLSLQVHPNQEYIESQFNQHMTQQESYYVMKNKPGAKVYLGLKDGVTGDQLLKASEEAHHSRVPLDLPSYVNECPSEKGTLYLIPPGTVHCSGQNNLVLEISSTTWWFTFKIYDYLRKDADGKPRPMNPEHARHNINDSIDTSAVESGLISRPTVIRNQGNNSEELLGQRDDLLFQVRRLTLQDTWIADTGGEFVMYNLVEGARVRLVPTANEEAAVEWGYAEAYIVPASVGEYRLENLSGSTCTLIAAKVSPDWNLPLLPPNRTSGTEAFDAFW
ncbi:class I mannose-6-phosphate isomerase [Paenibacillus sp. N3/727]|uniref:class I mannose-6-phosphate isomerase n=1 Tax=Paenibacillus sp. N3/727 TaxID=2925845 RepID=UPI001F53B420|nr:class I mannose-6-phosphate isomerase [Paenibacillus sp. N3/727]UNK18875.1 class I mannose-6-phosphate isomerase [Paenibacillus sp. N3/727]